MTASSHKHFPKVDRFMEEGQLGKARDRLHGMLSTYPNNLAIRRRLGDVYNKLYDPAMAGRYWYLESEKSEAMQNACAVFEQRCGHDPLEILRQIKFRGEMDSLESLSAVQTLRRLQEEIQARHGIVYHFDTTGADRYEPRGDGGKWILATLLVVLGLSGVWVCYGLFLLLRWVLRL